MNDHIPSVYQTVAAASREVLEALFDAGVYEEHLALTVEGVDDAAVGLEVHNVLIASGAVQQAEDTYQFPDLDRMREFMNAVADGLEDDDAALEPESATAADGEFIVFDDVPWHVPDLPSLPKGSTETLELPARGYQLRKVPFSKIRVFPAHNPRKRTARAGIARLAHNIAQRGLQQPITVRPLTEDSDAFELVFGYRRHAAIEYAMHQGWLPEDDDVVCIVRRLNDSQARLAALTENEEREEVDQLDVAEGWARLRLQQSESAIANAAGVTLTEVRRCIKVAFGVCEEAKALYRTGGVAWAALVAFSYGSLEAQRQYLEAASGASWRLSPEYVRQGMTSGDFKLAHARFTLEAYEAACGVLESDLWGTPDGTRLLSVNVVERLQRQWAEEHVKRLQNDGYAFVELRSGEWTWWSEFSQVARASEGAGAIVHVRPDLSVDVIVNVVPNATLADQRGTNPNAPLGQSNGSSETAAAPKIAFSEAGVTLARRTRTAALQNALLENADPKLPLALAVMGFLGEREVRIGIKPLGDTDAIMSSAILEAFESFASRIPNLRFSPSSGLELSSVHGSAGARLQTFQALLNLPKADLEHLHRILVATMIGDFSAATEANTWERRRSLKVDAFIAALADHLEVKGGEALEVTEPYLKTIGFRKQQLRPYLVHAFGEQVGAALLERPKARLIAELLEHKGKLAGFTPPELSFAEHSSQVIKLETDGDAFDDGDVEDALERDLDLVSEEEFDLSAVSVVVSDTLAAAD
jgi:ParB/RepB/Spo0J family partition protein